MTAVVQKLANHRGKLSRATPLRTDTPDYELATRNHSGGMLVGAVGSAAIGSCGIRDHTEKLEPLLMSIPLEQIADSLLRANLLSETELELVCSELSSDGNSVTPDRLLGHLADSGRLTEYQRKRVAEGRSGELVLGNYILLSRLGEGGMGEVYKALHRRMKRVVAIKVIRKKLATKDFIERFRKEIHAAARLNHPNAVSAYDADECELGDFLVMEYVEGADLKQIVEKQGPLSVGEAVDAIRQAARALGYAHRHGMVHRDVKPANLMRDLSGCIKVADLGLALVSSDGDEMQETSVDGAGIIAGTIDYMAPEQGIDAAMADGRADIYSLGCTLFYLLTGRVMFESRAPLKRLLAHRSNPPPKLHEAVPQADPELDVVFQRAVAKEADQRFTSMDDLITALDQWEQRRQQPVAQAASEWASTKVVIVEQSRLQAAMITRLLKDFGIHEVLACASGTEALEALALIPTGIVLISLQLPDMSGLLLAERIREGLRWSRVTAIIMTSDAVVPSFQEAVSHLGRVGLIQKPFDSATLADTICKLQRAELDETLAFNGLASRRVLIVDDSSIARKSIQKTLTELGFVNFTTADDGKPAVELMRQQDFDLVITDYTMPDMNGRDLVAWIRQQSRQKAVPIVMVTTEYEPAKLAEVYQLGVSAICGKSFDMDMVRNIIFRLFV